MRVASSDIGQVRRLLGMVTFWAVVIGALAMAEVALNYNPFFDLGPQLPSEELWMTVLYRGGGQRATASFSHPISLGMFAALLLPVAFWLAQHARSRSRTLLIGGGGLVIAAMLFATLSRGPWIGAFAALGIGLMIRPRRPRGGRAALALAICGLVALYLSGISPLTTIINDSFDPSTMDFSNFEYRQGLVPFVLDLWSRSPIFGYSDLSIAATSVDNYYLVLLLMSGAVGFLAFVGLMAVLVSRLLNVMRLRVASHDLGSDLAAMLLGAFIGQLLILGSVAMVGSAPYFFWGFAGLAAGAWATRTQQPAA
jgi:O-antigen ligase